MNKIKNWLGLPWPVYVGLLIYIPVSYFVLGLPAELAGLFVEEDHIYETIGAVSLFVAALIFTILLWRIRRTPHRRTTPWIKQVAILGLALFFFVAGGEEISWGQRIFRIATPQAIRAENVQGELNLHNLRFLDASGSSLLSQDHLMLISSFGFMLILPLAADLSQGVKSKLNRLIPYPSGSLGLLCVLNYIANKIAQGFFVARYTYPLVPLPQAVVEVKEGNIELLFGMSAICIALAILKSSPSATPAEQATQTH